MPVIKKSPRKKTHSVNIYDVAEQAGVSVVTVSRAFNNYPHVSARMKARIMQAARQVGFSPKLVAKPQRLAVIIGHFDQLHGADYKPQMLMHLIGCAARHGYAIEFIPAENVELAVQRSVDGVIEFGLTSREIACLDQLPHVPTVLINKEIPAATRWSTVCSDHRMEARMATEYLVERGHRRIALVLDERKGWSAEQRRAGYSEIMRGAYGRTVALNIWSAADQPLPALASELLDARCTGLVNLSDNKGPPLLGLLANKHGLRFPQDLSVIALENESFSPHWSPPLTTIAQPLMLLAEAAVSGLLNAMPSGNRVFHQTFPSRLIERESVSPLAAKPRAKSRRSNP